MLGAAHAMLHLAKENDVHVALLSDRINYRAPVPTHMWDRPFRDP
jgi:hypothetical protein